jgi:hypothetical protein
MTDEDTDDETREKRAIAGGVDFVEKLDTEEDTDE